MSVQAWAIGLAFALGMLIAGLGQEWRHDAIAKTLALEQAAILKQATDSAREKEQEWQENIENVRNEAQKRIDQADIDRKLASDVSVRLRKQVDTLARRPAECPSTSEGSEAADSSRLLLAELFAKVDARAGELAEYADAAHNAGVTCEKAYGVIKPP